MEIIYLCSTLQESGPVNQMYNIVKNIGGSGVTIKMISISPNPTDSRVTDFENQGVEVQSLDLSRLESFIYGPHAFKNAVDGSTDIIHSHGFRSDLISSLTPIDATKVNTIHSYYYNHHPLRYGSITGRCMAWTHINSLKGIDVPVACSESVASLVRSHHIAPEVIQNGIDARTFSPVTEKEKLKMRNELNLPLEKNIFISVGSFIERKNPEEVIKSFSETMAGDSHLLMLSDGPLLEHCQQLVAQNPNIDLLGRVPAVAPYLKASDYFISASQFEGLPMAVLEAIASGLPVCLSDIPPHDEVLSYDRNAGVTFDVSDRSRMVRAIETLIDGDYKTQTRAARGIVDNHLNSERMADKYQKLYRSVTSS